MSNSLPLDLNSATLITGASSGIGRQVAANLKARLGLEDKLHSLGFIRPYTNFLAQRTELLVSLFWLAALYASIRGL